MMDPFLPVGMESVDRFPIARLIGTPHSASGDGRSRPWKAPVTSRGTGQGHVGRTTDAAPGEEERAEPDARRTVSWSVWLGEDTVGMPPAGAGLVVDSPGAGRVAVGPAVDPGTDSG